MNEGVVKSPAELHYVHAVQIASKYAAPSFMPTMKAEITCNSNCLRMTEMKVFSVLGGGRNAKMWHIPLLQVYPAQKACVHVKRTVLD